MSKPIRRIILAAFVTIVALGASARAQRPEAGRGYRREFDSEPEHRLPSSNFRLRRTSGQREKIPAAANPQPHPNYELETLERMALANNPAVRGAQARLDAASGQWVQAGLKPNPTVGYVGDDIGADGSAGAQGAFVRQQFITGGKLALDQQVASHQVAKAEAQLSVAETRVLTDVRMQFYRVVLAQRRMNLSRDLIRVNQHAVDSAKRLWDAKEGRRVDYIRARIELDRIRMATDVAQAGYNSAWRELSMVVGLPQLERCQLIGAMAQTPPKLDFQKSADRLIQISPAMAAAWADVERTSWSIRRAEVQNIPDVEAGLEIKQDTAANNTLVVIETGFKLPLWNKNQGRIQEAHAQHAEANARARQIELRLRQQLAAEFHRYDAARARVSRFVREILPGAATTVELAESGLAVGELNYLDLLSARRTLFEANLDHLNALEQLWISAQRIDGMLLEGSLNAMP